VPAAGEHTFTTAIQTINGVADQMALNDAITTPFSVTTLYNTNQVVVVTVNTDDYGEETVWAIIDSNDEPVYISIDIESNNPEFYESNQTYVVEVPVESNECYTFTIIDLMADGMCCAYGEGSYTVATTDGTIIAQGGEFGQQEDVPFGIQNALGAESFTANGGITLYPNPANSIINIAVAQNATQPDAYTVYNNLGQVVGSGRISGSNQQINISAYADGVYFVKVDGGSGSQTLQFIKY
jgi:hypothetical protein